MNRINWANLKVGKVLGKLNRMAKFLLKTMDSFVLLLVLIGLWYLFGIFTDYYDPNSEMTVWTPMLPLLFALIVVIVGVLMSLIMLSIIFPKSYKTIINALDSKGDEDESGLNKRETWYVSIALFCYFVLLFVLSVRII